MEKTELKAINIIEKHLKVLTDQKNIDHIRSEYFELAISHSLLTIHFIPKNEENTMYWESVRKLVIKMNPNKLFKHRFIE